MKKQLAFALSIVAFLNVDSCEKQYQDMPTSPSGKIQTNQAKTGASLKKKGISPDRYLGCADGRYAIWQNYWEDKNQYSSLSGKYIGVGGDGDISRMQIYKNQYGCLLALGGSSFIDQLLSLGYSRDSIFVSLDGGWQQEVDFAISRGVKRFYVDEPINPEIQDPPPAVRQQWVRDSAPYIASRGGTLTISESEFNYWKCYISRDFGNIGEMVDLALSVIPHPSVSCHTHFSIEPPIPPGFPIDPRDQWTYIHDRVPDLFKMVWIKTRQTEEQMGLLFGHANNLGINQILLYPFDSDATTYIGKVEIASQQAWYQHWLLRLQEYVSQTWCCPDPYLTEECYLWTITHSGITRWAYY